MPDIDNPLPPDWIDAKHIATRGAMSIRDHGGVNVGIYRPLDSFAQLVVDQETANDLVYLLAQHFRFRLVAVVDIGWPSAQPYPVDKDG